MEKENYWHKTSEEVPEDGEVVFANGRLLTWNEDYECWDDEEGDDVFCEKDGIEFWCRIPEFDYQ